MGGSDLPDPVRVVRPPRDRRVLLTSTFEAAMSVLPARYRRSAHARPDAMTRLVEIGKFDNAIDAHYTLDVLADAGIEGDVFDENTGSAMPYLGVIGVRVVVREEDAERARAALASAPARLTFVDDEEDRDEAYSEDGDGEKPSLSPAEAWAARTRTIAFVGLGVWIVALVALARLMRPPAGIDVSV